MASKLTIEIDLGNDAMQTAEEAAGAISQALELQSACFDEPFNDHEVGTIRDENGNTVGRWEVQ